MANPNTPEDVTRKRLPQVPGDAARPASTGSWTPEDPTGVQLAVPTHVGRFQIQAVLGIGSYGRVLLAYDPEMGRQVAIKQPFGDGLKPEYRDDFLKEARAAAVIDQHANVCPVYHIDTDAGLPYIVMRFVAGGTLRNMIERRAEPLPVRTSLIIARKIAMGLSAAHAKGVIHRDLKPANVLIDDANREVLITDFGLARIATRTQAAASLQRGAHGTPYYMPPEQCGTQMFGPITPVADVYSLGIMLYEMLVGRVPFMGSHLELMMQHCNEVPRPPSSVRPGLDPRLDALCLKAMEKMPGNRYRSAKEFADAISEYLRGGEVELIEPLPLGEEMLEAELLPLPPPPAPSSQRPTSNPNPQSPRRPGAAFPSASTASLPEATLDEKEIVRCPKCNSRLEIAKSRLKPVDCPMCELKFSVEAGRQAAARASRKTGAKEKERERPPTAEPVRRRDERRVDRRPLVREEEEDAIPRREWQPAARGLRLAWMGMILGGLFALGLAMTAIVAASDDSPSSTRTTSTYTKEDELRDSKYPPPKDSTKVVTTALATLCGLGIALGLVVISLGRALASRLPAGVSGGGGAILSAVMGWMAAVCVAIAFVTLPWLTDDSPSNRDDDTTVFGIAGIAMGIGMMLLVIGEFGFNQYLTAVGRNLREYFPRTLTSVARVVLWIFLACVLFGGISGGIMGAMGNKDHPLFGFFALLISGAMCMTMALVPFWLIVSVWLNIHAAVAVGRYAYEDV